MPRLKFIVAYDGSSFSGWQIQKGAPSIQEKLEASLSELTCTPIRIHGSGRTDAGVHALGQVFHADLPEGFYIEAGNWPRAVNSKLPAAIRLISASPAASDFHARFSASGKTYEYKLVTSRVLMPFDFQRAGHYPQPMDGELFCQAIALFAGTHDFHAFAAIRGNEPSPLPEDFYQRTIFEALSQPTDDGFLIRFTGTGFLYKMVRLMVGSALAVATGKISLDYLENQINSPTSPKARFCASPYGLRLLEVHYP